MIANMRINQTLVSKIGLKSQVAREENDVRSVLPASSEMRHLQDLQVAGQGQTRQRSNSNMCEALQTKRTTPQVCSHQQDPSPWLCSEPVQVPAGRPCSALALRFPSKDQTADRQGIWTCATKTTLASSSNRVCRKLLASKVVQIWCVLYHGRQRREVCLQSARFLA